MYANPAVAPGAEVQMLRGVRGGLRIEDERIAREPRRLARRLAPSGLRPLLVIGGARERANRNVQLIAHDCDVSAASSATARCRSCAHLINACASSSKNTPR